MIRTNQLPKQKPTGKLASPVPNWDGNRENSEKFQNTYLDDLYIPKLKTDPKFCRSFVTNSFQKQPMDLSTKECRIPVKMNDKIVSILIDSGSTQCLVGPELLLIIPKAKDMLKVLSHPVTGIAANGDKFYCKHSMELFLSINGKEFPVNALYSENVNYPLILGYGFLARHKIVIDFKHLTVLQKREEEYPVQLCKEVVIPPKSETVVLGYLRKEIPKGTGLVTSSLQIQQQNS